MILKYDISQGIEARKKACLEFQIKNKRHVKENQKSESLSTFDNSKWRMIVLSQQ